MNKKYIFLSKLKKKHIVEKAYVLGKPSAYKIDDKEYIYLRYSKKHILGKKHVYWYGIENKFLLKLIKFDSYIVFIAEEPSKNIKISAKSIYDLFRDERLAKDNNWKIHIFEAGSNFELSINKENLNNYLNLYNI